MKKLHLQLISLLHWLSDADKEVLSRQEIDDFDKRSVLSFGFTVFVAMFTATMVTFYSVKAISDSFSLGLISAMIVGGLVLFMDRAMFRTVGVKSIILRITISLCIGLFLSSGAKMSLSQSMIKDQIEEETRVKNDELYIEMVNPVKAKYESQIEDLKQRIRGIALNCPNCRTAMSNLRNDVFDLEKKYEKELNKAENNYKHSWIRPDLSGSNMVIKLWELTVFPNKNTDKVAWTLHIILFIIIFLFEALPTLMRLSVSSDNTYYKAIVHKRKLISGIQKELYKIDYLQEPERLKNMRRAFYQERIRQIRNNQPDVDLLDELDEKIKEAEYAYYQPQEAIINGATRQTPAPGADPEIPAFSYS